MSNVMRLFETADCMTPLMCLTKAAESTEDMQNVVVLWTSKANPKNLQFTCSGFSVTELNLLMDHVKMLILHGEFNE